MRSTVASRLSRLFLVAVAIACLCAGCSSGSPSTFTLSSASVDTTTYWCPPGSSNAPYKLYATIQAHNGTTSSVTIESVGAVLTLAAVKGSWLQHIGDKYAAGDVTFTPNTVGAGSDSTVTVTVPSSCTNGKQPANFSNVADYSVALTVTTSSGTHMITTQNRHRIVSG